MTLVPRRFLVGMFPMWIYPYLVLSLLHMLVMMWPLLNRGIFDPGLNGQTLFHLCAWFVYAVLYLLPGLIPIVAVGFLWRRSPLTVQVVGVLSTSSCLLFIFADSLIYELFNFHFNGFVLNLLVTPGGVESLGTGLSTYLSVIGIVVRTLVIQSLLMVIVCRGLRPFVVKRRWIAATVGFWLLAVLVQGLLYGISDLRKDGVIFDTAKVYPFFQRVRFRSLAARLGVEVENAKIISTRVDSARLRYPQLPVTFEGISNPPNIVWLVAESLRWDQLDSEIMPNAWALAQRSQHFKNHYSTGNGTRESMFGMFYGLYGSYWESFLTARRGPLLMERIQDLGYELDLRTSAQFTYPEFDKTLFVNVPAEKLIEADGSLPAWQRDQINTDALIQFLGRRDTARPFMSFFFMESTHARYSFPEDSALRGSYAEEINYARMSKASIRPHIHKIKNRYANAAHWLDIQIGRIVAELENQGLLDNTILIITGDHGEEFLEKGSWGHNSYFVEEQTHVPLIVSMPGKAPETINRVTSHMDIGTTLLQRLGAGGSAGNYSLGANLFATVSRPYITISDWHSIGVITPDMKFRVPYINRGEMYWPPTGGDDEKLKKARQVELLSKNHGAILQAIQNTSMFLLRKGEDPKDPRHLAL